MEVYPASFFFASGSCEEPEFCSTLPPILYFPWFITRQDFYSSVFEWPLLFSFLIHERVTEGLTLQPNRIQRRETFVIKVGSRSTRPSYAPRCLPSRTKMPRSPVLFDKICVHDPQLTFERGKKISRLPRSFFFFFLQ